jgi:peptidoglycan/xylan/chitin deacetylase (PgdA/CDA1 family)
VKVPRGKGVPILMYHSISNQAAHGFRDCIVSPEVFAQQMRYLAQQGYTPISVTRLVQARAVGGACMPSRPVVLTFDDGYADFYTEALPVLRQHGFSATLYVTSGCVGGTSRWLKHEGESQRRLLSWQQLGEICDSGIECGAHSLSHPHLDTLPAGVAREEIERSKQELEDGLGQLVASFAYPYGHYDRRVRDLVQMAGYDSACAVTPALSVPADDVFGLARIMVLDRPDLSWFADRLDGKRVTILPRDSVRPWFSGLIRRSRARLTSSA